MQRSIHSHHSAKTGSRRLSGVLGLTLLIIGVLLPAAYIPLCGNVSFCSYAPKATVILFICACLSALIVIKGRFTLLWLTGSGCAIVIATTIYTSYARIREFHPQDELEVGTVDLVMHALASKFHWDVGIFIMSLGVVLLFFAAGAGGRIKNWILSSRKNI
jgi:hypothetical protein